MTKRNPSRVKVEIYDMPSGHPYCMELALIALVFCRRFGIKNPTHNDFLPIAYQFIAWKLNWAWSPF